MKGRDVDTDCRHGRIEIRKCLVYNEREMITCTDQWKQLKTVFKIESERIIKSTGETSRQTRYYISSLKASAKQFNKYTRSHRAIENNLHWTLDVVFGKDQSRKRKGHAAKNFNIIRKTVMALLVNEQSWKVSKKQKKFQSAQ